MKILITDDVHPFMLETFKHRDYEVDYFPNCSYEDVLDVIQEYEGLIINSKVLVNTSFIDKATKLIFVGRLGSGMEIIEQEYCKVKGIHVFNSPDGNCDAVAEHAMSLLLACLNQICLANKEVKEFKWNRESRRGIELGGKTVGIIGCGHTGTAFLRRLAGWNVNVLVYDKYKSDFLQDFNFAIQTSLEEVLMKSDIVSLHLPLNNETNYFADENFIQQMRPDSILINTSRGKIVKTQALIDALESGHLYGACLDVFENEKQEFLTEDEILLYKNLYQFEQVIVSPHVAGWTKESKMKLSEILVKKILFCLDTIK